MQATDCASEVLRIVGMSDPEDFETGSVSSYCRYINTLSCERRGCNSKYLDLKTSQWAMLSIFFGIGPR